MFNGGMKESHEIVLVGLDKRWIEGSTWLLQRRLVVESNWGFYLNLVSIIVALVGLFVEKLIFLFGRAFVIIFILANKISVQSHLVQLAFQIWWVKEYIDLRISTNTNHSTFGKMYFFHRVPLKTYFFLSFCIGLSTPITLF